VARLGKPYTIVKAEASSVNSTVIWLEAARQVPTLRVGEVPEEALSVTIDRPQMPSARKSQVVVTWVTSWSFWGTVTFTHVPTRASSPIEVESLPSPPVEPRLSLPPGSWPGSTGSLSSHAVISSRATSARPASPPRRRRRWRRRSPSRS
jgi:hypothetical protein